VPCYSRQAEAASKAEAKAAREAEAAAKQAEKEVRAAAKAAEAEEKARAKAEADEVRASCCCGLKLQQQVWLQQQQLGFCSTVATNAGHAGTLQLVQTIQCSAASCRQPLQHGQLLNDTN
jgi:hypothetical protein